MPRYLLVALALCCAPAASAQKVFVAASNNSIVASTEESQGGAPAHTLIVTNLSSVPVIVWSVSLTACENVRQQCGPRKTNITVDPGMRRTVGRVEARNQELGFSYRWSYSWRPDSSDARVLAALREAEAATEAPPATPAMPAEPATPATPATPAAPVTAEPQPAAPASMTPPAAPLPPLVASTEVDGVAQATSAIAPTRQFWVTNKSAYPIVVYSFNLASCVNVKQPCTATPVDVRVPAGARRQIARVDAADRKKRYTYDWTYEWQPDASDARVAAALRARGVRDGAMGHAENLATQPPASATPTRGAVFLDAQNRPVATSERFRFKVSPSSILGSTQVKGAAVRATGACIDPHELSLLERDTTITGAPAIAPRLRPTSIALPTLPPELSGTTPADAKVVVRWVVDTTGNTVPGSVSVIESPHGLLSVRMCGAVLGAHVEPGRDEGGRAVRTWVEAPLLVAH